MNTASLKRISDTPLRSDGPRIRVAGDGYLVAGVSAGMNDRDAYAKLFAAAPDMLAALKKARRWIPDNTARDAVDAAIAKVED